jgi:hypothetical protein
VVGARERHQILSDALLNTLEGYWRVRSFQNLGEGEYFFEPNITHGKEMNKRLISLVANAAGTLRLREKMMVKKKKK